MSHSFVGENDYPLGPALALATFVTGFTALGRIYLGVHSIPDIVGGIVIEIPILWGLVYTIHDLDHFVMNSDGALYLPGFLCILMLLAYPRPNVWTNAYGDTATIAGAGHGAIFGSALGIPLGLPNVPLPWLEGRERP